MSLLIKDIEMPIGCWWRDSLGLYRECPFFDRDHYCYKLNREVSDNCAKRPFDCPFIKVPTPHGRLIDADALMELYEPAPEDVNEWEHYTTTISVIRQNIKDAPTIIEAEE